ncbi:alpha-mannosidase [Subdoligranulum sp. AF14-43]|nr:alpha-mannosidase [Subdoligranulum sp. AF14-43]
MKTPVTHMIGNAHIDPAWLWRWPDGFAEVKATFRSALDRMNEYEDFVFTCGCTQYYQWVEENEPEMFEEIRLRVSQGRWVPVGGWLIQSDCNSPSGESFARQSLYGQRYLMEKFGRYAHVGYNVDSFGHCATLPQILQNSGMDAYVMMRPQDFEMSLPGNTFWWQSRDGSRVRAFRIPLAYASYWAEQDPLFEKQEKTLEQARQDGTDTMNFYGVGNHGGGPTIRNIETIHKLQKAAEKGAVLFSSPDAFFQSLEKQQTPLPLVTTELQHHASGCYSAHLRTKQNNRRTEQALLHAERSDVLCKGLMNDTYGEKELKEAWKKVLFNQFHDIMGGCSIPEVYEDAADFYGYAATIAAETANQALQRISWHIDTMKGGPFPLSRDKDWLTWEKEDLGVPVVVFNTLGWEVTGPVVIDRKLAGVVNEDGSPVPHQTVRAPRSDLANIWDSVFQATVPALGYRVYWLYCDKQTETPESSVRADSDTLSMENECVCLTFDAKSGMLKSWLDKTSGMLLFDGPAGRAVVLDEEHIDTWGHSRNYWDRPKGEFGNARVRVLESGPVRTKIRVTSEYGKSELEQDFILYAGRSSVEVEGRVFWRERHRMLKLEFPLKAQNARSFYQIPYGFLERPANGEEEPCQQWADVCGTRADGSGIGVAILNTGNQSASIRGNVLGFTALRSPIYAESAGLYMENEGVHEPECICMEQGESMFRYTIFPHGFDGTGKHAAQLTREAAARNLPFTVRKETYHKGCLPQIYSGLKVPRENIAVTVLKRAEDGHANVLRLYETAGTDCTARIECPLLGRSLELKLRAHEIKTLVLPDDPDTPVYESDFLERTK